MSSSTAPALAPLPSPQTSEADDSDNAADFQLAHWLSTVDVDQADNSLDDDSKRLFMLSQALFNDCGPALAACIVHSAAHCGLKPLLAHAHGSDPRLAAVAVLNLLYVLERRSKPGDPFHLIIDHSSATSDAPTQLSGRFPTLLVVRERIATSLVPLAEIFLQCVSEGDFCPDFLYYLLSLLIEFIAHADASVYLRRVMARVPSQAFLKAIMRTWKNPRYYAYVMEQDSPTLGFLVSYYLTSLCTTHVAPLDGAVPTDISAEDLSHRPSGLSAIRAMPDWAIKFIVMRLYHSSTTSQEQSRLMSVLSECAALSPGFAKLALKLAVFPAIEHCLSPLTAHMATTGGDLSSVSTEALRDAIPYITLMITLVDAFVPPDVRIGGGLPTIDGETEVFSAFMPALKCVMELGIHMVVQRKFSADSNHLFEQSVLAIVCRLLARVWRVGLATLPLDDEDVPFRSAILEDMVGFVKKNCAVVGKPFEELLQERFFLPFEICVGVYSWPDSAVDFATNIDANSQFCHSCLALDEDLRMCGTCKRVQYCNEQHQLVHWHRGHRLECRFLRNKLQDCPFSVDGDRVCGLRLKDGEPLDIPFGSYSEHQRRHLLRLGYAMPGTFVETFYDGRSKGVRYFTTPEMCARLRHIRDERVRKNTAAAIAACLHSSFLRGMLYIRADAEAGSEVLYVYPPSADQSLCLTVRML